MKPQKDASPNHHKAHSCRLNQRRGWCLTGRGRGEQLWGGGEVSSYGSNIQIVRSTLTVAWTVATPATTAPAKIGRASFILEAGHFRLTNNIVSWRYKKIEIRACIVVSTQASWGERKIEIERYRENRVALPCFGRAGKGAGERGGREGFKGGKSLWESRKGKGDEAKPKTEKREDELRPPGPVGGLGSAPSWTCSARRSRATVLGRASCTHTGGSSTDQGSMGEGGEKRRASRNRGILGRTAPARCFEQSWAAAASSSRALETHEVSGACERGVEGKDAEVLHRDCSPRSEGGSKGLGRGRGHAGV